MEISARAAYRGQVTKIIKSALEYLKDDRSRVEERNSGDLDEIEEELTSFIHRLSASHESLNAINEEIKQKGILKADDAMEKIVEYQDQAIGTLARLKTRLSKLQQKRTPISTEPMEGLNTARPVNNGPKLPHLPLKHFDGNFHAWLPFWEQFRTAVHENAGLSPVEKFNYMESVLTGEAKKFIEGFTPSERCYEAAISLLQEQFGDADRLIDQHIHELVNLQPIRDKVDARGLRNLYTKVITSTRSLTALQVPTNHYSVMLRSILLRCLPTELRIDYHRREENKDSMGNSVVSGNVSESSVSPNDEVSSILRFLKQQVNSLERSGLSRTRAIVKSTPGTASSLVTISETDACAFCQSKQHSTGNCDSSLTLSEKKELLRKSGRCFRCAKRGHMAKKCRSGLLLSCQRCARKHMTSMCDGQRSSTSARETTVKTDGSRRPSGHASASLCSHSGKECIYLKTVTCVVVTSNKRIALRAVIDGGSQYTFIKETIAQRLNLEIIGNIDLSIVSFGSKEIQSRKVLPKVRMSLQAGKKLVSLEAVLVPEICVDVLAAPNPNCATFKGIKLADLRPKDVEFEEGLSLLIGADFYWTVVTGNQRRLTSNLRAVQTIFGWAIQGIHTASGENTLLNTNNSLRSSCLLSVATIEPQIDTHFWSLELIGIKAADEEKTTLMENLADKCIEREGSRYVARLPWKEPRTCLRSNKGQAICRMDSLFRKLSRNPTKLYEYDNAVRQLVTEGIAEPVENVLDDLQTTERHVFYLPHRPVYKEESATTKLRIVFDASAREEGNSSLNDLLWVGANLIPDVMTVLLNFRLRSVGLVADIEKAFLQIILHEDDRDTHRFLWFAECLKSPFIKPKIKAFRMTRVTFGVRSSPFLLCAVIQRHLEAEKLSFPVTCAALRNFYMDDLAISVDSEDEAITICAEAACILKRASMNLHKWNSNSAKVLAAMNLKDSPTVQKVLGLGWIVSTDELYVPMDSIDVIFRSPMTSPTKRKVLQAIARIYDPLGILGPIIIKLKILFQKLWRNNFHWDEVLAGEFLMEWNSCVTSALDLKDFTWPRSVSSFPSTEGLFQIHVFADASTKAFGAVAYLKHIVQDETSVRFLCARNRVAPIKEKDYNELTLSKLELTAALIAARLCSYLHKSLGLQVDDYFLWSDSKITLSWIKGDSQKWKPYVRNRVDEIKRLTKASQWLYCIGKDNPADLLTRGISGKILCKSSTWIYGPTWLRTIEKCYADGNKMLPEVTTPAALLLNTVSVPENIQKPLFDYQQYSSWNQVLRVTAYVKRFIKNARNRVGIPKEVSTAAVFLSAEEILAAENYWIRFIQNENFYEEISLLQKEKPLCSTSRLLELTPFIDDVGILRVGGRLQLLDESIDVKHPIILPANSHIVRLIIIDVHQSLLHAGVGTVLVNLRERFWILKGRQVIKKLIKNCVTCRKLWGPPATHPFAPLPIERISLIRPFDVVGVDFAGPLYCYNISDGASKVYLTIFTCAAVRAVHIELVPSLSTDQFILALRRFIARRGSPSMVLSDNARTFRRAALEINSNGFSTEYVQGFLSRRRIKWRFIVERAPWWGGFWERMVRTIKNTLKVTIGKAKLGFEELRTLITETEEVVNSRPLTYTNADALDLNPLTPRDFLQWPRPTESSSSDNVADAPSLRNIWKQRFHFIQKLRKRWRMEYLQLLRSFHYKAGKRSTPIKEGDIVLVFDQSSPRISWKMAKVNQAYVGRDGRIRSCEIKLADGKLLRRPIQHLYPLELSARPLEDVEN